VRASVQASDSEPGMEATDSDAAGDSVHIRKRTGRDRGRRTHRFPVVRETRSGTAALAKAASLQVSGMT